MTTFSTSCKPLPFYADGETPLMDVDLYAMLRELDTLSANNLLGLCEALVSQLRYTGEVQ